MSSPTPSPEDDLSPDLSSLMANDKVQQELLTHELHNKTEREAELEERVLENNERRSVLVRRASIQQQKKAHTERISAAFQLIDIDKSGELSSSEIIKGIHRNSDVRSILMLPEDSEISASEYDELFRRIDVDNSAGVSFEEFEIFVDTIFKEERERKLDDAKKKRASEEAKLKADHKLAEKLAEDRVAAAEDTLSIIREKFEESLGFDEVVSKLEMIKQDVTSFLTSEKPVERELAEAWYEVWESRRLLMIHREGKRVGENIGVDPKFEAKFKAWTSRINQWEKWNNVQIAFQNLAGEGRDSAPLDQIVDTLEAGDKQFLQLVNLPPKPLMLSNLLFGAANEEEEQEEEKKTTDQNNNSSLQNLLFDAAEEEESTPTSLSPLDSSIQTLNSFKTIEIHNHHFTIAFSPTIGNVQSAFSLIALNNPNTPPRPSGAIKVKELKKALLSNNPHLLKLLDITTENASFDKIYSTLLESPAENPIDLNTFTHMFVPNYKAYLSFVRLKKILPTKLSDEYENSKMSREELTQFYEKDVFAAHLIKQTNLNQSIATMINSLPDIDINRRHMIMFLEPKFSKLILSPSKFNSEDEEEDEDPTDPTDPTSDPTSTSTSTPANQIGVVTKSTVEAAFQLINVNNKRTLNRKELITSLRDNKLVQRLLQLPTRNHAHNNRWKKMMGKLNSGKYEDCGLPDFISLFENVQEDVNIEEQKLEERKRRGSLSRRNSKEQTGVVIHKKIVPVLNFELAEKYLRTRNAFDMLDLNGDGMLSTDELEEQVLRNSELRDLLDLSLDELDVVVKRLDIHVMSANIDWELFRSFFVPMEVLPESLGGANPETAGENGLEGNRHKISENIKGYTGDNVDMWQRGEMGADRVMSDMLASMEAMIDTTKDDQEPDPALPYDEEVVQDLGWIDEEDMYDRMEEEGPPPIPERGTEVKLDAPYIDGPQWYVVMSPREELGMEGPMGIRSLLDFWDDEIIDSHTLVWKEGLNDWLPIDDVADLKAQLLLPELHSTFRPNTAPGSLSSFEKKVKKIIDPKPIKLEVIGLDKPCHYCGGIATCHIDDAQNHRQLNQGLKDGIAVSSEDDEKSEILNDFLFLGNAAASRERNVEIMEYTHIINCSKDLPCYWDLDADNNTWIRNSTREDVDGTIIGDDKAIMKYRRLKKLNIKYFRVKLDDDPFGRPDTAASRYTADSWRDSEFSSRPLTALTDPFFASSRPGTGAGSSRPGSTSRPGSRSLSSRPMTGGGSRPMTAADIEMIPEFEHTEQEQEYAMGYNAAAISIQASYRGSKSRESSRPGTGEDRRPPPIPTQMPLSAEQIAAIEEAKAKLDHMKRQVVDQIISGFEAVYEWLSRENQSRKVRCLVHSISGSCSAASVIGAYIIRTQGLSYNEVLSHLRTKHGIQRVQIHDTVWEDALRIYSQTYSIGQLLCDDCFLEQFVEGKADERAFSEKVETVVERLKLNDKSLQILDLRDETLGGTQGDDDKKEPNGISFLCNALRDSYYLIQLNLSGNNLNDEDCMHIGSALLTNEGLTVLNLSYNKIGCKGAKEIAAALKLHSLAVLNIGYNVIKESGGSELGNMLRHNSNLTDLDLGNNSIGDVGGHDLFDALTTPLYESEEVMLKKAKVYEQGGVVDDIGEVFNCTLTSLSVSCNDLGQESAKRLVGVLQVNMVLAILNLDYNPKLGNTEVRELASAMRTYQPSLEWLSFSDNNVGNDVAGAFARSIGDQSCLLKKLTLAQNCLRSTGISRISGSLKDNHLLVFLDLARNPMGSKGALHLAEALKHNFVLRELLIDCCGIDAEGARGLGEVLCVNKSLTRLDLADNSLLTKGVNCIAMGLKENVGIKDINLTNTGIGVKSSEKLSDALKVNTTLEVLNLSNNQVRNHGCIKLAEMLEVNHTLRSLDLGFNGINAAGINAIVTAMKTTSESREDAKALELDVILVGNQFSKTVGEVQNAQIMVPPKLARSKITWENATTSSIDVPMWSKKEENVNFVRRPSFSQAAGEEFDLAHPHSEFAITNNLITSKSEDNFGIITEVAEPVDVPRWRETMKKAGNNVENIEGVSSWNNAFKKGL
ncbi:hypothetical protein TrLO_g7500 [Triparma laevis f. longispina]|uniref:EF-hand domain-containing protein n=1 Tax=Triparma laevis f. longispina TaxID=1714387 RepID=A0A9W7AKV1_9STRA|nr:hypothetical protein TrLO_g7500 [Triparma laevis f. longispina]